jgi:hypothetical protein
MRSRSRAPAHPHLQYHEHQQKEYEQPDLELPAGLVSNHTLRIRFTSAQNFSNTCRRKAHPKPAEAPVASAANTMTFPPDPAVTGKILPAIDVMRPTLPPTTKEIPSKKAPPGNLAAASKPKPKVDPQGVPYKRPPASIRPATFADVATVAAIEGGVGPAPHPSGVKQGPPVLTGASTKPPVPRLPTSHPLRMRKALGWASDYRQHRDDERKQQYLKRHAPNEDWSRCDQIDAASRSSCESKICANGLCEHSAVLWECLVCPSG